MGANVLGPNWAWSAKAARQGVLFALPWIALSFAPLDKWVPAMADVCSHTDSSRRRPWASSSAATGGGGKWPARRRSCRRVRALWRKRPSEEWRSAASPRPSRGCCASARGDGRPRRPRRDGRGRRRRRGRLRRAARLLPGLRAAGGARGRVLWRRLRVLSGNLLVAAVAHAAVDAVAFVTCYWSLCRRSAADKAKLAARSFKVTDAPLRRRGDGVAGDRTPASASRGAASRLRAGRQQTAQARPGALPSRLEGSARSCFRRLLSFRA